LQAGYSVRRTSRKLSRLAPRAVAAPLRLLVLTCNPLDAGERWGLQPLDKDREWEVIREAVRGREVRLERLSSCNLAAIRSKVQEFQPHVVHLVCHGVKDNNGDPCLLLESPQGRGTYVSGDDLWSSISSPDLRLVVLPGCATGRTSPVNVFGGVATALLRNDVPSVLATQHPLSDTAGHCLAQALYSALAAGAHLEEAVTQTRLAIKDQEGLDRAAWGVMACWTRVDGDHPLVNPGTGPAAARDEELEGPRPPWPYVTPNRASRALHQAIADRHHPFVLLRGGSGSGKTALVDQVYRELDRQPARYDIDCAGRSGPVGGMVTQVSMFLQQYGAPATEDPQFRAAVEQADQAGDKTAFAEAVEKAVSMWARLARRQRTLFVLDSLEFALRPEANGECSVADEPFKGWLQAILRAEWSDTTFVFVSRHPVQLFSPLLNSGAQRISLEGLSKEETLLLMDKWTRISQARPSAKDEAFRQLGGNPLSLMLLEDRLERWDRGLDTVLQAEPEAFWGDLQRERREHLFHRDYQRLSEAEQRLLKHLTLGGKRDRRSLEDQGFTRRMLQRLLILGLVEEISGPNGSGAG
jgi:hypothetical protein